MQSLIQTLVARPAGVFLFLLAAAFLEVLGDSFFQSALHRPSSTPRWVLYAGGAAILSFYGFVVNLPHWDFGKLLGVYVAFFFVAAQIVAWIRFHQKLSLPTLVGGSMIVVGGFLISFWKR
jgi:small multidrug resistance family-3 protein